MDVGEMALLPVVTLIGLALVIWPAEAARFRVMFWVRGGELTPFAIGWMRISGVIFLLCAVAIIAKSFTA